MATSSIAARRAWWRLPPPTVGFGIVLCAIGATAQDPPAAKRRLPVGEQRRLADAVIEATKALPGSHLDGVRALIELENRAAASQPGEVRPIRIRELKARSPKPEVDAAAAVPTLPRTVAYSFALRITAPIGRRPTERAELERSVPIELARLGMLPGSDRVLALLEGELDSDPSAVAFARFLDSWRCGDETLYELLDRNACTEQSVMGYQRMIGDFVEQMAAADRELAQPLRKTEAAARNALQRAFENYRAYRSFREGLAHSLLLPPDVPMPRALRHFEDGGAKGYSLRQQVLMVMALHDEDPQRVAALVGDAAAPLPVPPWNGTYDGLATWRAVYDAALPRMIALGGHTDIWLAKAVAKRAEQVERVRAAAKRASDG